jgi:hypothetical protein
MTQQSRWIFAAARVLGAAAIVFGSLDSAAQPAQPMQSPIIALEAHVGQPTLVERALLSRLREELQSLGFTALPPLVNKQAGERAARPALTDVGMTAAEIKRQVDAGHDAFTAGDFQKAVELLTRAVALIRRNPALLALDTGHTDMVFRAYLSLGFSQDKLSQSMDSFATLSELIRMYPSRRFPTSEYGPLAEKLYRVIYKQVVALGRGGLFVDANQPHAMIFVDGQMRGLGTVTVPELLVGVHHVFIRSPDSGRRFDVEIKRDLEHTLQAVPEVDAALHVGDDWVGFQLVTEAERDRVPRYVSDVMRRWNAGVMAAVYGTMKLEGKPAIAVTLHRSNGARVRPTAFVPVEDGDEASLHALARYLADGTIGAKLRILSRGVDEALSPGSPRADRGRSTMISRLVLGTGAVTFVAGGLLYGLSEADDHLTPTYDDKKTPAVALMVGGSLVLGAGVSLWLHETRSRSWLTCAMLGGGVAQLVAGSALYLTDQDELAQASGYYQRQYFRDTALAGAITGTTGLAMTAIGVWLLHREGEIVSAPPPAGPRRGTVGSAARAMPTISVAPSRLVIGLTGAF